jgi:hypothetical protein
VILAKTIEDHLMPAKTIETLDVPTRRKWRQWLAEHHDSESEICLVFNKCHTGVRFTRDGRDDRLLWV